MMMNVRLGMRQGVALSAILLAAGCAPTGSSSGRIDSRTTTKAERESGKMYTADLDSAADEVAQALVLDLNRLAEEDFGDYRATVIFGDILNKTGTMSTNEFELVRSRIRSKLMGSRDVRNNLRFVEKSRRVQDLNEREYGGGEEDLLGEGRRAGNAPERTPKDYTFYLNGDANAIHRGSTKKYYLEFQLSRASDGELVFLKSYEMKYGKG